MMRFLIAVITAIALTGGPFLAWKMDQSARAQTASHLKPERIVIGLDLSKSNPLIEDPRFAAKVAARIAAKVKKLGFASQVHVRTFGNYDAGSNTFYYDMTISMRNRPEQVAADIQKLISGVPHLVKRGKWVAQNNTNIIAFLDNVRESIGCKQMPTHVLLATDGIEDSEYVRLGRGGHLPKPDGKPFKACRELQILGLGQGTKSPMETVRLRKEWTAFASAAGFAKFQGLNDW